MGEILKNLVNLFRPQRVEVESTSPWIHVTPVSGSGNGEVIVTVDANPDTTERTGAIVYNISKGGTVRQVVKQAAATVEKKKLTIRNNTGKLVAIQLWSDEVDYSFEEQWADIAQPEIKAGESLTIRQGEEVLCDAREAQVMPLGDYMVYLYVDYDMKRVGTLYGLVRLGDAVELTAQAPPAGMGTFALDATYGELSVENGSTISQHQTALTYWVNASKDGTDIYSGGSPAGMIQFSSKDANGQPDNSDPVISGKPSWIDVSVGEGPGISDVEVGFSIQKNTSLLMREAEVSLTKFGKTFVFSINQEAGGTLPPLQLYAVEIKNNTDKDLTVSIWEGLPTDDWENSGMSYLLMPRDSWTLKLGDAVNPDGTKLVKGKTYCVCVKSGDAGSVTTYPLPYQTFTAGNGTVVNIDY